MPPTKIALMLAAPALMIAAGCAQTGPLGSHTATLGSLKAGVSHLEFENEQLRRKVAQLESDNREAEQRLTQEEAANGDLTARLDDARNLLKRKGYAVADEGRSGSARGGEEASEPATTVPAARSNRKPRKAPFARIPGRIDAVGPDEPADPAGGEAPDPPSAHPHDDLGPQSRRDGDGGGSEGDADRWLPVARDPGATSSRVR